MKFYSVKPKPFAWTVVNASGVEIAASWGSRDSAYLTCDLMNMAYDAGRDWRGTGTRDEMTRAQERVIERLRSFSDAYPLEIFPELTGEEREALPYGVMERISASMGRHCSKIMREAADMLSRCNVEI